MPDTGAPHSLPWPPSTGVTPDVPRDMQTLAEQIAARLGYIGKSVIATEQSRTSGIEAVLTTPDRVAGVVVPADALVEVYFEADIKESSADAATVVLMIGTTAVAVAVDMQTTSTVPAGTYGGIHTSGVGGGEGSGPIAVGLGGLSFWNLVPSSSAASSINPVVCRVNAGTYDIEARYAASGGATVTAKNRRLIVHVKPTV